MVEVQYSTCNTRMPFQAMRIRLELERPRAVPEWEANRAAEGRLQIFSSQFTRP
jgi:hypothetical protein